VQKFQIETIVNSASSEITRQGYSLDEKGIADWLIDKNVMSHKSDEDSNPYFIDFGFDLGEPSNDKTSSAKKYLAKAFPDKILEINNFYDKKD